MSGAYGSPSRRGGTGAPSDMQSEMTRFTRATDMSPVKSASAFGAGGEEQFVLSVKRQ